MKISNFKFQISKRFTRANFLRNLFGFTFIEMVVAIAVIGLILPALFAIIFVILQQQTRIYRLSEIKRQGDFVLNTVENVIRNYASAIYSDIGLSNIKCNTGGSSYIYPTEGQLYFMDKDGNWLRFYTSIVDGVNYFASQSAKVTSINLTSNKVQINNLTIGCSRTAAYSPPIIAISFDIGYNTTSSRIEEIASLKYQTNVKLRSY